MYLMIFDWLKSVFRKVLKSMDIESRPYAEPQRPQSRLRIYLTLNEAHYFKKRIYYAHSVEKLQELARRHMRALRSTHCKDRERSEKALERIRAMMASRTGNPLLRCSFPKKVQREMGLLPEV